MAQRPGVFIVCPVIAVKVGKPDFVKRIFQCVLFIGILFIGILFIRILFIGVRTLKVLFILRGPFVEKVMNIVTSTFSVIREATDECDTRNNYA